MARRAGYGGSVQWATFTIAGVTEWEINAEGEALDSTGMDSAGVAAYIPGITRWSGRVAGKWDSTDTNSLRHGAPPAITPGSTATVNLYVVGATDTSDYVCTVVYVTGWRTTVSLEGIVTWEMTFQGSGALTYPTVS